MIRIKPGARLHPVYAMTVALLAAERVYAKRGVDCVVTEGVGGVHKAGSLHHDGLAVDLRITNISRLKRDALVTELAKALGDEFDVLWERQGEAQEHVHVEFDS